MSSWREYEQHIVSVFQEKFPKLSVTPSDHVWGQFSRVKRQVDVSLRGVMADNDLLGVAECKHFNRKVDVKVVDSFIGFLEDVKANFGVIITNRGFTQAATNRASIKDIELDIIKFNQLDDYQPPISLLSDMRRKQRWTASDS